MMFHEITFEGSKVKDWPFFELDTYKNHRLYYLPKSAEDKHGFNFVVFSFNSCNMSTKNWWIDPNSDLEVEAILYGHASDGLKHVWAGDNDSVESELTQIKTNGYTYYPDSLVMERVYKKLRELEVKYCQSISDVKLVEE